MARTKRYRPDMDGSFQTAYDKARRQVIAESDVCALCGLPVDKHLKFPHPMSATVDHIIPVSKGGHPADRQNLQLAHLICNQVKASKLVIEQNKDIAKESETISNRKLPHSVNWLAYKG